MRPSPIFFLALQLIAVAHGCSTVHVLSPDNATVIARTMELGGSGGEVQESPVNFRGFHARSLGGGHGLPWRVVAHRRGEVLGAAMNMVCDKSTHVPWTTKLGYVSVDVSVRTPLPAFNVSINLASDGINEAGLSVSEHTLRQSIYQTADVTATAATRQSVCFSAVTAWLLGNVVSVRSLREEILPALRVLGPTVPMPSGDLLHWAIDDAHGEHVVLEYLDGEMHLHNNTVGTFTNDPDFTWQLRNLNNYANLSPDWPHGGEGITVQSEVGALPHAVGHGFNLLGLPGDYSPPSRFVKLFYLRQYAMMRSPPASLNASISLAIGLLANVFINQGTVASQKPTSAGLELTQYSVLKIPLHKEFYFRSYESTQWKRVRLAELDFTPKKAAPTSGGGSSSRSLPIADGTIGVEDVTAELR